jgi:hypothetical protein
LRGIPGKPLKPSGREQANLARVEAEIGLVADVQDRMVGLVGIVHLQYLSADLHAIADHTTEEFPL